MTVVPITVYRSEAGLFAEREGRHFFLPGASLDQLFQADEPAAWLQKRLATAKAIDAPTTWLPPIEHQEVWAAGVTYLRSRDARTDESKDAGGGDFYDRVYAAERPEIFFKATPHRVVGHDGQVRLRSDARWNVPEPEVALAISSGGRIFGYTIGNDMSSRDIEGENPLYLPQAKVYSACCGLGPGIVVRAPLPPSTVIRLRISRQGTEAVQQETSLAQMKRGFPELAEFLYRDNDFPCGAFLLTGTGVVPSNDFTLASGDEIRIAIDGLGVLLNTVA